MQTTIINGVILGLYRDDGLENGNNYFVGMLSPIQAFHVDPYHLHVLPMYPYVTFKILLYP